MLVSSNVAGDTNGLFGGINVKNKASQCKPGTHSLVRMRDPNIAHQILNKGGYDEVQLCICCWNHKKVLCPYRGNEPAGACPSFVLDEANVEMTEQRMMEFLTMPQQKLAA